MSNWRYAVRTKISFGRQLGRVMLDGAARGKQGFANVWWERSVEELEATCHQHDPRPWLLRVVGFPDFGRCADVWQRPELVLLGGHVWPGSLAQLLFDAPGGNHGHRNMGIEGQGNFTGA